MQTKGIKRIFAKFNECVVLMLDAAVFDRKDDLILIFTYIAPENSPIYTDEDNGVILLNEKNSRNSLRTPKGRALCGRRPER